jgi:hypothetical protein
MKYIAILLITSFSFACNNDKPKATPVIDKIEASSNKDFTNANTINEELFKNVKIKLSVINDILKAGKNSITINADNVSSLSSIQQVVVQFKDARKLIFEQKETTPDSTKKLIAELKNTLVNAQQKEFPKLRAKFIKYKAEQMWENNIYVTGNGKSILITGAIFASNATIKEANEKIVDILTDLRFKTVCYGWYKGQSDVQCFTLSSSANDADIMYQH